MRDFDEEKTLSYKSIPEIRDKYKEKFLATAVSPEEALFQTEWQVFCEMDSEQLTPDFVRNLLEKQASYYKKELEDVPEARKEQEGIYKDLVKIESALDSINGDKPAEVIIKYFEGLENEQRIILNSATNILEKGQLIGKDDPITQADRLRKSINKSNNLINK